MLLHLTVASPAPFPTSLKPRMCEIECILPLPTCTGPILPCQCCGMFFIYIASSGMMVNVRYRRAASYSYRPQIICFGWRPRTYRIYKPPPPYQRIPETINNMSRWCSKYCHVCLIFCWSMLQIYAWGLFMSSLVLYVRQADSYKCWTVPWYTANVVWVFTTLKWSGDEKVWDVEGCWLLWVHHRTGIDMIEV